MPPPVSAAVRAIAAIGVCAAFSAARAADAPDTGARTTIAPTSTDTTSTDTAEPEAPNLDAERWRLRLEPAVAYLGASGDLTMPVSSGPAGQASLSSLNLDSPRLSPFGRVIATKGDWGFSVFGFGFETDGRGSVQNSAGSLGDVSWAAGDRLLADLAYQNADLAVSYRLLHKVSDPNARGVPAARADLHLLAGVRFHNADAEIRLDPSVTLAPGSAAETDGQAFFAEPLLGARLDLDFGETFGLDVESAVGAFGAGGSTSASFSIDAGFTYRPVHWLGARIGYHLLVFDLEEDEDDLAWRGAMAGLYWGVQISF